MSPIIILIVLAIVALIVWNLWAAKRAPSESTSDSSSPAAESLIDGLSLNKSTGVVLDGTTDHTPQQGHYLATACDLAYYGQDDASPKFREQLNLSAKLISIDNTQAYVCENTGSIVVAFRGSESPTSIDGFKDWLLTNARNFLVLPEGRIGTDFAAAGVGARFHRGFMEALAEIWEPLHAAIAEAMQRHERPVWITGHSLGGAVALLAAWRLQQAFIPVHRICTFGAPMIGNNAAAEAYLREFPGRIIRYVDFSDMVPKLPTMSLLVNHYDHVQREIILGSDATQSAAQVMEQAADSATDGEVDEAVANSLWSELHSGINAHLMGNYLSRISDQIG